VLRESAVEADEIRHRCARLVQSPKCFHFCVEIVPRMWKIVMCARFAIAVRRALGVVRFDSVNVGFLW
jgi:plasmid stabilization system protein ParE